MTIKTHEPELADFDPRELPACERCGRHTELQLAERYNRSIMAVCPECAKQIFIESADHYMNKLTVLTLWAFSVGVAVSAIVCRLIEK